MNLSAVQYGRNNGQWNGSRNIEHLSLPLRGCLLRLQQRLPALATPVQLPPAAVGAVAAAAAALEQPLVTGPWLPMCSRPMLAMLGQWVGPARKQQVNSMMQSQSDM